MRGQWFIDGSWLPLEEEESDLIEQEHLNHFRGQQIQDTFETDLIVKTVDSKDGERNRYSFLALQKTKCSNRTDPMIKGK